MFWASAGYTMGEGLETYRTGGLESSSLTRAADRGCMAFACMLLWRSFGSCFAVGVH